MIQKNCPSSLTVRKLRTKKYRKHVCGQKNKTRNTVRLTLVQVDDFSKMLNSSYGMIQT